MRLKLVQSQINREILQRLPCHQSAHGFVPGRSPLTAVEPHVANAVVLRMDLRDFFPSINASRVFGLFRSLGYPYAVTQLLTNLCTSTRTLGELDAIESELRSTGTLNRQTMDEARRLYFQKHLPQGAPSSPALANLIAYRLDCRLSGVAQRLGLNYTRYADDLIFSGDRFLGRIANSFAIQVGAIAAEEGFRVQFRKTKIMRSGTRQLVTGIVINQRPNCSRIEYDQLKATLHNCARYGPSTQNLDKHAHFRAHLQGRINWVAHLNPTRGRKLRQIFETIAWSSE
jgi:RNA-directed DNA polymerase